MCDFAFTCSFRIEFFGPYIAGYFVYPLGQQNPEKNWDVFREFKAKGLLLSKVYGDSQCSFEGWSIRLLIFNKFSDRNRAEIIIVS